jgi:hypothetical protein
MTLGNMRANGVRSLDVSCWQCHHRAILSADPWSDDVPVPTFGMPPPNPLDRLAGMILQGRVMRSTFSRGSKLTGLLTGRCQLLRSIGSALVAFPWDVR